MTSGRRVGWALVATGPLLLALLLPIGALGAGGPGFDRIVGWANILGFSVSAAGFVLVIVDRAGPVTFSTQALSEAADRLAVQVLEQEGRQRARLLGTGRLDTVAANVSYQAERLVRYATAEAAAGDLDGVGRFYAECDAGRLVILGQPGSGKTVLALELLVQLLEARQDPARPVPVRFSLPSWNTAQPLKAWLAADLSDRYGLSAALATALVDAYRILPVLDGLDEMDPAQATVAVDQLNGYLSGRSGAPLVLTCRAADYERLPDVVRPATEIAIRPLTAGQVGDYLERVLDVRLFPAWRPVLGHLGDPRILEVLRTPWRLTLAVAYHRAGGSPADLLPRTDEDDYPGRVVAALLSAFVPARTRLYGADRYDPEQVSAWCARIAGHLGDTVDIVLSEWWRTAEATRVRRWHTVAAGILTAAGGMLTAVALDGGLAATGRDIAGALRAFPDVPAGQVLAGAWLVALVLAGTVLAVWHASRPRVAPTLVTVRQLRTLRGRRQFVRGLAAGLALWLAVGIGLGLMIGIATTGFLPGLISGCVGGLVLGGVVGLVRGVAPAGLATTDPREPLRNDLAVCLALGVVFALGFGLAMGLTGGLAGATVQRLVVTVSAGLTTGLKGGVLGGLLGGLTSGLVFGLVVRIGGHAWLRYAVATVFSAGRGRLPWRFGAFLHWAYQAGIMRNAGNAYQFRHVELRDWLRRG